MRNSLLKLQISFQKFSISTSFQKRLMWTVNHRTVISAPVSSECNSWETEAVGSGSVSATWYTYDLTAHCSQHMAV